MSQFGAPTVMQECQREAFRGGGGFALNNLTWENTF